MGCEESVRAQDTRDQLPYNPASHLTQFKGRLFMRRKLTVVWLGCIALTLLLSGAVAAAQTITGSVRGTVTDPNGLVVAGAQVVVTNTGTGVTTHTVTDKSGLYNVGFLVLGNYAVTATAPGFETASVGPFTVQIDQIVTADAKLQVGKASTTVDVVADQSLLLNTENSTISTSISSSTLENMPLDGMNIQVATLFVPGAINPSASAMGGQLGTGRDAFTPHEEGPADAIPSFNGNRQQSNSYILDGVDINETLQNAIGYTPSPFSIQEVHVITGNAAKWSWSPRVEPINSMAASLEIIKIAGSMPIPGQTNTAALPDRAITKISLARRSAALSSRTSSSSSATTKGFAGAR
jgi:hypothetical protein